MFFTFGNLRIRLPKTSSNICLVLITTIYLVISYYHNKHRFYLLNGFVFAMCENIRVSGTTVTANFRLVILLSAAL